MFMQHHLSCVVEHYRALKSCAEYTVVRAGSTALADRPTPLVRNCSVAARRPPALNKRVTRLVSPSLMQNSACKTIKKPSNAADVLS